MKIHEATAGDVTVLALAESALDAETAPAFRDDMARRLARGGKVLLDLSALSFVDSTGIGAILGCVRAAADAGATLKLCGLRGIVRAAFEIVRLHRLLDSYASRADALEAFQRSCPA